MRYVKIGFVLFTFFYVCSLFSFPFFPEKECPTLTSSQLCQISSGKNKTLKPNHSSKNLLRHACHIESETVFEGASKGTICECRYAIPPQWNEGTASSSSLLTIYARILSTSSTNPTKTPCPKLSFRVYDTLVTGHTFEDKNHRLWRSQKRPTLLTLPTTKAAQHTSIRGPLFIEPLQKKTWIVCRYIFNNFPITIQKEKSGSTDLLR